MPEDLVSRDGFSRPVPRQPAHLHTQAESGAYLRDSSRVPRRRPFMKPPYAIGSVPCLSGHAIAYRWKGTGNVDPAIRRLLLFNSIFWLRRKHLISIALDEKQDAIFVHTHMIHLFRPDPTRPTLSSEPWRAKCLYSQTGGYFSCSLVILQIYISSKQSGTGRI